MINITEKKNTVSRPVKVLQFGEGNFLRAFVDWQIDIANEKAGFDGNIVLIQPLPQDSTGMYNDQKCLYTTILRGVQHGKNVEETRIIDSVTKCVNCYTAYDEYMSYAESSDLRFIVSNTTEAGIVYTEGCNLEDTPPVSFPAKVTQFLYKRFKHFNGDKKAGLIFIPCELIDKNGTKLKEHVLHHAADWNLEAEFVAWINEACTFCNSLVDRIVPGYPRNEAPAWCAKLGYQDNLIDQAEPFHLWVIETDGDIEALKKEFPLEQAGLNVVWTNDMSFYRTRKVRILNGTHSMFTAAAFLSGLTTVEESINNPVIYSFIKLGLFGEIIPSMDGDTNELFNYANSVLERFSNPYIRHLLIDICLNYTSKFKTRDLPSIKGYMDKYGTVPQCLAFSIAAITMFYKGKDIANRSMTGERDGEAYSIKDDESVLSFFEELHKRTSDAKELANAVLTNEALWGEDLTKLPGLEEAIAHDISEIQTKGMLQAVDGVRPSVIRPVK